MLLRLLRKLLQEAANELMHLSAYTIGISIGRHNSEDESYYISHNFHLGSNEIGQLLQRPQLIEEWFLDVGFEDLEDDP